MAEPPTGHQTTLAIVWQRRIWRCEYAKGPSSLGSLRLFRDQTIAMERRVRDVEDMLSVAVTWRRLIEDELIPAVDAPRVPPAEDRREKPPERRKVPRGGRRRTDPGR